MEKTVNEKQLKNEMTSYVSEHETDEEYGPRAAFRICRALSDSTWSYVSSNTDGSDSIVFTSLDGNTIVEILNAIGDELLHGSQIASMFGDKVLGLAKGLNAYYKSGQNYAACRDEIDKALGLE